MPKGLIRIKTLIAWATIQTIRKMSTANGIARMLSKGEGSIAIMAKPVIVERAWAASIPGVVFFEEVEAGAFESARSGFAPSASEVVPSSRKGKSHKYLLIILVVWTP